MISPLPLAFIGTGVMGLSMARHLQEAGHQLHVYNRTREKAAPLVENGAVWHDSAGSAAAAAEVIFSMVGFPSDVEAIYFQPEGILAHAQPGSIVVDFTSSSPALALRIEAAARQGGFSALDAPVSGGDIGAREAKLVIMVGGEPATFAKVKPLLDLLGKHVALMGPAGAGQHCKIANQIAVAVGMVAWCEALAYARKAGLDPATVHAAISGGAAGSWAMANLAPRAMSGNFAPGFYAKHLLKDIRLAKESSGQMSLPLPGLDCANAQYEAVVARGWGESGTQTLYRLYEAQ